MKTNKLRNTNLRQTHTSLTYIFQHCLPWLWRQNSFDVKKLLRHKQIWPPWEEAHKMASHVWQSRLLEVLLQARRLCFGDCLKCLDLSFPIFGFWYYWWEVTLWNVLIAYQNSRYLYNIGKLVFSIFVRTHWSYMVII